MMNKLISSISIEASALADAFCWDSIYALDPSAMPTQSSSWARAVQAGSGSRIVSRWYRFSDGLEAVLPLFRRSIVPFAVSVLNSPPPAWGFGGALSSAPLRTGHLAAILDDCGDLPGAAISIRPNPLHGADWIWTSALKGWSTVPRNAHVLDLEGGFETVWTTRFSGNARNRVRRAQRTGVTVETGNSETLISEFDFLFRRSVDRWARRQNEYRWLAQMRAHLRDSSRKFREMARNAGDILQVGIARHEERPVAGAIVLLGPNAHYTRGAMDECRMGKTYANYLLQSTMIENACERHCRHYHMGETGISRSLARFKGAFGAIPVPYAEIRFERLPIYSTDQRIRSEIKRLIGFSDE